MLTLIGINSINQNFSSKIHVDSATCLNHSSSLLSFSMALTLDLTHFSPGLLSKVNADTASVEKIEVTGGFQSSDWTNFNHSHLHPTWHPDPRGFHRDPRRLHTLPPAPREFPPQSPSTSVHPHPTSISTWAQLPPAIHGTVVAST